MSTRIYPLYQKGGPQLRVFLPNFWLKLVRPPVQQPPNVVQFMCSMEMTKYDIKNYLQKIYNVQCVNIRTRIALGKTKLEPGRGYVIKNDDVKYAYVVLPKDQKFEFPNLFPEEKEKELKEQERSIDEVQKGQDAFIDNNKDRPGTPGWFSL